MSHRAELEHLPQLYVHAGMRPPLVNVPNNGVDVSKKPWNRPPTVIEYCSRGSNG